MFGGTAKRYCSYELVGQPFKDGKSYYINVISPSSGKTLKVRWYSDKAHADLMPKNGKENKPFYKLFGFKDRQDSIRCIRRFGLTKEEEISYLGWTRGWSAGEFFGGVWYGSLENILPPIKNQDNIFQVTWKEFKEDAQSRSDIGSCWFSEEAM